MASDVGNGRTERACRVELFGIARLLAGRRLIEVELGERADVRSVLRELGARCPALVGPVIRPDLAGLAEGHALNLNGLRFVVDPDAAVAPGDALILLSSSAGG